MKNKSICIGLLILSFCTVISCSKSIDSDYSYSGTSASEEYDSNESDNNVLPSM